jgi:hypothetical protein
MRGRIYPFLHQFTWDAASGHSNASGTLVSRQCVCWNPEALVWSAGHYSLVMIAIANIQQHEKRVSSGTHSIRRHKQDSRISHIDIC